MKYLRKMALLLALVLALSGCGQQGAKESASETEKESVRSEEVAASSQTDVSAASSEQAFDNLGEPRVLALKGPTAMGMVSMMEAAEAMQGNPAPVFEIVASPDQVVPALTKGDADLAAVPANLASVLYNKTQGEIQVLAINTLGVLYIVETGDTIHQLADLKGRTLYASGQGATPEYALRALLASAGISEDEVNIVWKSEHAECLAALQEDPEGVAMLPQPFVTVAQSKVEGLRVALDLTKEWDAGEQAAHPESPSALVTGVLVGRKAYLREHEAEVAAFLKAYEQSVQWVNTQVDAAAALVGKYDIVPEPVAKKAIPACNIVFISGDAMKEKLSGYLQRLHEQNPKSVGGSLPGDDFYYGTSN